MGTGEEAVTTAETLAAAAPPAAAAPDTALPAAVDIAVVGSGFSGLAMAVRLRQAGISDFVLLERAGDVGGTWRDNSYPGCACDVPSHLYSFSFAPNPDWSSTFSPQPEIWDYLRRVARDQGILPHVRYHTELESAAWDESRRRWQLRTSQGPLSARVLVSASGPLSEPSMPSLPGLEGFQGTVFHSATWKHQHALAGERVAVVGTGASSIQFLPRIQPLAGKLHLFQRTAPWIMPRRARPISRAEHALFRRVPAAQRLMRAAICWAREVYAIPLLNAGLAPITRMLGRANIRRHIADPELRRKLTPDYAPGCKRILISNDYLPALAEPNVEVVTDAIAEVRAHSIVTADGVEREVDTIIFGTGFHVTDFPIAHRIRGRDGRTLAETWDGSGQANRGTTVAGFPNLFLLLGPNTGLGHTSVVLMAEAQVAYVMKALRHMAAEELAAIDVRARAQAGWNAAIQRQMPDTVWVAGGCASWYLDRNGRNTSIWPSFTFRFRSRLRQFDAHNYEGLAQTPARPEPAALGVAVPA
jgi:cation diffusion facilitator CzcD-associated flavoprotein CzcO